MTPAGVWPPWRSRSSWPLKVWLMDSMTWRSGLKKRVPAPSGSGWRAGGAGRCGHRRGRFRRTLVSSPCPRRPPPHSPAVPILPTHGWLSWRASEPAELPEADLFGTETGLSGTWVPAAPYTWHVPAMDLVGTQEAILARRSCEQTFLLAAQPPPAPHPGLSLAARLTHSARRRSSELGRLGNESARRRSLARPHGGEPSSCAIRSMSRSVYPSVGGPQGVPAGPRD